MYKALLLACLLTVPAFAQGRLLLNEADARKNLLKSPAPVAPAGVHATGKVVLLVEIAPDGHVLSARPDTGNSKLREPAADAVKQWRFKPFTLHNEKVSASTKLTVDFATANEPKPARSVAAESAALEPRAEPKAKPARTPPLEPTAATPATATPTADPLQSFQALEDQCRTLVSSQAVPAAQAHTCSQAAEVADHLEGPTSDVLRRAAYVYAATALMRVDNLKAAQAYGDKAIAVVKAGHDDDSGASAAYAVRGQARAFAGQLPGADADLTRAEAAQRQAIAAHPQDPAQRAALKNLLLFHAKLLQALKQPAEAATKTTEADTL